MKSVLIVSLILYLLLIEISGAPISSSSSRVITDINILSGNQGVPTDDISIDSFPSSPGCPHSIDGYPWLYSGDSIPRCYLASYRGPCPEGEMIVVQPDSPYGSCACECLSILVNVEYQQALKSDLNVNRYKTCLNETSVVGPQGQVYDQMEYKCYSYYDQGPCPEGTIIVHGRNEEVEITCQPLCSDLIGNARKTAVERGECSSGKVGAVTNIWTENGCQPGKKYSKILRKCIQDFSKKNQVLTI